MFLQSIFIIVLNLRTSKQKCCHNCSEPKSVVRISLFFFIISQTARFSKSWDVALNNYFKVTIIIHYKFISLFICTSNHLEKPQSLVSYDSTFHKIILHSTEGISYALEGYLTLFISLTVSLLLDRVNERGMSSPLQDR